MELHNDRQAMAIALEWAAKAMYSTSPNPRVGCVLVQGGSVIGAGHTQPAGQPHAEAQALSDARSRGHSTAGATAYVTLEPCSHHGRTPPCADALIDAGVARVVAAVADPNPLVAGKGIARLRAAGITVECGVMEQESVEMNLGFFRRMQHGVPWVRMKSAASLDGKTALHGGASQWITGPAARADGHHWRARACAVLTGIGTVRSDDPLLTVRVVETHRQPRRVLVDSRLAIHAEARILHGDPIWIFSAREDRPKQAMLQALGHQVFCLPNAEGKVDLPGMVAELGRQQINELHIEAGSKLNGSLIRSECVDELLLYLAPSLLGEARGMFDLPAIDNLAQRRQLAFHAVEQIGPDLRILARFT